MMNDYLDGTPYTLEQPSNMYHFNIASELLGKFMYIKHNETLLDIGCSTGALLAYGSLYKPQSLTGIDLHQEVVDQCKKNMDDNHIKANVFVQDVRTYHPESRYDVIVCNPPYFKKVENQLSVYKQTARFDETLSLPDLFKAVKRLLKDRGKFYIVYPAYGLNDLMSYGISNGMRPIKMRFTYPDDKHEAEHVLIAYQISNKSNVSIGKPIYLNDRTTFIE